MGNDQIPEQARLVAIQLQTALAARSVIDRALGIVMSHQGGTAVEALVSLRARSEHRGVNLSVVAQDIVDDAVRRAVAGQATT